MEAPLFVVVVITVINLKIWLRSKTLPIAHL